MTVKTLEDLKFWCLNNNIPLENARFALGEDKVEKRWFGIYQKPDGEWVVYKNKDDGTRFIRYQGDSEEEAVHILLDKIKDEVRLRKDGPKSKKAKKKEHLHKTLIVIATLVCIFGISTLLAFCSSRINRYNGYYKHQNTYYYKDSLKWYYYDDYAGSWVRDRHKNHDKEFYDTYEDYYEGTYYRSEYDTGDFKDTDYYYENHYSNDDDDDYDYSWDSGSGWDSYDTDWGSDW